MGDDVVGSPLFPSSGDGPIREPSSDDLLRSSFGLIPFFAIAAHLARLLFGRCAEPDDNHGEIGLRLCVVLNKIGALCNEAVKLRAEFDAIVEEVKALEKASADHSS